MTYTNEFLKIEDREVFDGKNQTGYFQIWGNEDIEILAFFDNSQSETFAIWTSEESHLPETGEEGRNWLEALDWEIENFSYLRNENFKPLNEIFHLD